MTSLFPSLKKASIAPDPTAGGTSNVTFNWDAWEEETTKKAVDCEKCKDIDWQDHEEMVVCKGCGAVRGTTSPHGSRIQILQ
jgi:hypothetical protein